MIADASYAILVRRMITNLEVARNENENNASVLRRFKKRMQSAGVLPKVRAIRYKRRPPSKLAKKKSALKRLQKHAARQKLYKLGKISAPTASGK